MTSPRQQHLEVIRKACVAANPEIGEEKCLLCGNKKCDYSTTGCPWYRGRPIRLADVLLAIGHEAPLHIVWASDGLAYFVDERVRKTLGTWNLRADDLDQQSDESIDFIHSLIAR